MVNKLALKFLVLMQDKMVETSIGFRLVQFALTRLGTFALHDGQGRWRFDYRLTFVGWPSLPMTDWHFAIYANELYLEHDVKVIIRPGSCGALLPDQRLIDVITVQGAFADNKLDEAMFHKWIPVVAA